MVPYPTSARLFHVLPSDPLDFPCPSECYFQYLLLLTLDSFPANNPALISQRVDREVCQAAITELPSSKWSCLHNHGEKIQPVLHFEWLLEKQRVKSKVLFAHQKTKLYTSIQWKNKVLSFLFSIAEDRVGANNNNWEEKKKKCLWWMFFLSLI